MTHHSVCTSKVAIGCSYLCSNCQTHLSMKYTKSQIRRTDKTRHNASKIGIEVPQKIKNEIK